MVDDKKGYGDFRITLCIERNANRDLIYYIFHYQKNMIYKLKYANQRSILEKLLLKGKVSRITNN